MISAIAFAGTEYPSQTSLSDLIVRGNDAGMGGYMRRDPMRTASMHGSLLGFRTERGVISSSLWKEALILAWSSVSATGFEKRW